MELAVRRSWLTGLWADLPPIGGERMQMSEQFDSGPAGALPFDADRFLRAQDEAGTYVQALTELRRGRKVSHWMWFVFPQLAGLGRSSTARHYALASADQARAYLAHPVLGSRLRECATAVASLEGVTAEEVFGGIDAVKLRSSMTLFAEASPDDSPFRRVLDTYFDGEPDHATLDRLRHG